MNWGNLTVTMGIGYQLPVCGQMAIGKSEDAVFHHIYSQSMHPLEMVAGQYKQALKTWLCPACKSPRPGTKQIDVVVERMSAGGKAALNLVMGTDVAVARRDLLLSLGTERVSRDLYVGTVALRDGSLIDGLVTFRGRRSMLVRGSKNVSYQCCVECGKALYFSTIGNRYLVGQPPLGAEIFESQMWGLIFSNEVAKGLDLAKWDRITHEVLPVLPVPIDGLGHLDPLAGDNSED